MQLESMQKSQDARVNSTSETHIVGVDYFTWQFFALQFTY